MVVRAQAGGHQQAARVGLVSILRHDGLAHHLSGKLGVDPDLLPRLAQLELFGARLLGLGGGDEVVLQHAVDDVELADARPRGVADRVVSRRRFGQACQHRSLGDRHILQRLAKIGLRRSRKTVGALSQKDLVHVDLQDFFLGQHVLQLEGEQHLVDLSGVALFC